MSTVGGVHGHHGKPVCMNRSRFFPLLQSQPIQTCPTSFSSSDVNRISQMKRRFPWECTFILDTYVAGNRFKKKKKSCMKNSQRARVSSICKSEVRLRVCMWVCVFLSEFFISVNLCNYVPTEGGIKASFICWDDEYDSGLLYRLHICRQTHINLRP